MLTPLLLLCFINDTLATVQCKIRFYADGVSLYSEISPINDCICLQNDIKYLFNWSETCKLAAAANYMLNKTPRMQKKAKPIRSSSYLTMDSYMHSCD